MVLIKISLVNIKLVGCSSHCTLISEWTNNQQKATGQTSGPVPLSPPVSSSVWNKPTKKAQSRLDTSANSWPSLSGSIWGLSKSGSRTGNFGFFWVPYRIFSFYRAVFSFLVAASQTQEVTRFTDWAIFFGHFFYFWAGSILQAFISLI